MLVGRACADVQAAIAQESPLEEAEFATIRDRHFWIAAGLVEQAACVRLQLPTSCPDGELSLMIALDLAPSGGTKGSAPCGTVDTFEIE